MTIHHIHLTAPPAWALDNAAAWAAHGEVRLWTAEDLRARFGARFGAAEEAGRAPVFLSNLARFLVVEADGGCYADWDARPAGDVFSEVDPAMFSIAPHRALFPRVEHAFFCAPAGSEIVRQILREMDFTGYISARLTGLLAGRTKEPWVRLDRRFNAPPDAPGALVEHAYFSSSQTRRKGRLLDAGGRGSGGVFSERARRIYNAPHDPPNAARGRV